MKRILLGAVVLLMSGVILSYCATRESVPAVFQFTRPGQYGRLQITSGLMGALSGSKGQLHLPVLNSRSSPVWVQEGNRGGYNPWQTQERQSRVWLPTAHRNFSSRSLRSSLCGCKPRGEEINYSR